MAMGSPHRAMALESRDLDAASCSPAERPRSSSSKSGNDSAEDESSDEDSDAKSAGGASPGVSTAQNWQLVLGGVLAVLAPAAAVAVFSCKGDLVTILSVNKADQLTGGEVWSRIVALLASPLLVFLGLLSPLRGAMFLDTPEPAVGLWEALQRSVGKLKVLTGEILLFAVGFYFNLATEWDVLKQFWALSSQHVLFGLKVSLLGLSSIWSAAVAFRDFPVPLLGLRLALAIVASLRLLPACLLILGVFLYINNPSPEWVEWGITPFVKLRASAEFVEVFVLALPSMQIEIFALLSGTPLDDKGELLLSSTVSLLGAAHAFASIDSKGQALRRVSGIPTVVGTAEDSSMAFLLVFFYRLCNLGSRVLLFPLTFAVNGFRAGLPCLVVDIVLQLVLVWRTTRSVSKLPFALANVFSATEPLLLRGDPICTVSISSWLVIHLAELAGVVLATRIQDPGHFQRAYEADPLLSSLFVVFSLLQWPLIILLRTCFTHQFDGEDAEPVVGVMISGEADQDARTYAPARSGHMHRRADAADFRSPIGLARMWWPSLRSKGGTWNGSLQGFGDRGVRVISKLLKEDPLCKNLWLEMNAIGDDGAIALAEALQDIDTLEWLDLHGNFVTDVGARALADVLQRRPGCLRELWLSNNPIQDEELKQTLEKLVKLRIDPKAEEEAENVSADESEEV